MSRDDVIFGDRQAEREVAAVAVASAAGTELVLSRLDPDDMYDSRLRRIVEASRFLADIGPFTTPMSGEEQRALWPMTRPSSEHVRTVAVAVLADEVIAYVRQLVGERSTFQDTAGQFPPRVTEAAEKRRAMMALGDARKRLDNGEPVRDVFQQLQGLGA